MILYGGKGSSQSLLPCANMKPAQQNSESVTERSSTVLSFFLRATAILTDEVCSASVVPGSRLPAEHGADGRASSSRDSTPTPPTRRLRLASDMAYRTKTGADNGG